MVEYWLFRLIIMVMRPIPLRTGYRIAAFVASICYYFFHDKRRALKQNLSRVLDTTDDAYIESVARRAFMNFGRYVVDFIHFPVLTKDEIRSRLRFDQWTEMDEIGNCNRGVLVVTLHFGNWDHGAAAIAAYGYPLSAIVDLFKYERMNRLVQRSREKLGMKVIPMDRVGPGVFRALRRNEMLAMLIDTPRSDFAIKVPFFGALAEVSSAPARIALRTGARVVPAVVLRGSDDPAVIHPIIDSGLDYEPTGDEDADVRNLTTAIMACLEKQIRRHPDQWFILRRMWPASEQPAKEHEPIPSRA